MSIVRGLVLVHLSATALLLAAFVLLALFQRLAQSAQRSPAAVPYLSDAAPAVPAPAAPEVLSPAPGARPGASVLDWTIDLREPRPAGARLQTS